MTAADNPYFARAIANRVWAHLMGRGIVEPVDDFRESNPPSNPELLDALADALRPGRISGQTADPPDHEFGDLSVERASRPPVSHPTGPTRSATSRRPRSKMLTAEQILDAISSATGIPERFPGYPPGTRAIEIAEGEVPNQFLRAFTKPVRNDACDCARESEPSLNQVIHLVNNADLLAKIESPENRLARAIEGGKDRHGTGRARIPGDPQSAPDRTGNGDGARAHRPGSGPPGRTARPAARPDQLERVSVASLKSTGALYS